MSQNLSHKEFDGPWKLDAEKKENGGMTAMPDRIAAAQLILIRDEVRESNRINRELLQGINTIKHFFHELGIEKLRLLVKEKHREVALRKAKRLRRRAADRRRRALVKGAA